MATKPCRECRREISTKAKTCPHCGKKSPTTGWWEVVAGVGAATIGFLALSMLLGGNGDSSATSADDAALALAAREVDQPMPAAEQQLLQRFRQACSEYDAQPNEIKKSAVFRKSRSILAHIGKVQGWTGTLTRISTNQGGANATLVIQVGSSQIYDNDVVLGSPVYSAAAEMVEGQKVEFSGHDLSDLNLLERGKVCDPDFEITLTSLK